jgi:hypothetical protein
LSRIAAIRRRSAAIAEVGGLPRRVFGGIWRRRSSIERKRVPHGTFFAAPIELAEPPLAENGEDRARESCSLSERLWRGVALVRLLAKGARGETVDSVNSFDKARLAQARTCDDPFRAGERRRAWENGFLGGQFQQAVARHLQAAWGPLPRYRRNAIPNP